MRHHVAVPPGLQRKKMLCPLVSLLLSLPLTRPQSTLLVPQHYPLHLQKQLLISRSAPLFSSVLISAYYIHCLAHPHPAALHVYSRAVVATHKSPPGPNGGPDVFEVTLNSLSLGNIILNAGDTTGVLAVYSSTTLDSLKIGMSQGDKTTNLPHPSPPTKLILMTDSTHPQAPCKRTLLQRLHCEPSCPLIPTLFPTPTSQHTQTIPSCQLTQCSHHSCHRPNSRHNPTLPSSLPHLMLDIFRSRRWRVLSVHV